MKDQEHSGEPLSLRVTKSDAAKKIQKQIDEGEALFIEEPRSNEELDELREKEQIWSDYNEELLKRLFTTPAVSEEYAAFYGGAIALNPSFGQEVARWKSGVRDSITRLRSIFRRLELMSAPQQDGQLGRAPRTPTSSRGRRVFLVHGHNNEAKSTVARFLEKLDLEVTILHEQPDRGRTIIEKFEQNATVGYAVILLTADDVGGVLADSPELQPRARQNVILELGYFIGSLGRTHVCALREEAVEIPSDYSGVLYIDFDPEGAWKLRLATEIKAAGIELDLNRTI